MSGAVHLHLLLFYDVHVAALRFTCTATLICWLRKNPKRYLIVRVTRKREIAVC